jgi:hypothetical protein
MTALLILGAVLVLGSIVLSWHVHVVRMQKRGDRP